MKKKTLHSSQLLAGSMLMLSVCAVSPLTKAQAQNTEASAQQGRSIKGVITDDKGNPLPAVLVTIKGTEAGTMSDIDGAYELQLPQGTTAGTLLFSTVGYTDLEVAFDETTGAQQVTMSGKVGGLDEVVVIGYGTAKQKDLTASIATITSKDFNKGVMGTPDQMIQGKIPGLVITPSSGQPGVSGTIRIRGTASLSAKNDPLIVIDGVPVDFDNIDGAPSPLSMINPNDIESFTVLKDAAATAIYGNRASNGVILITTKKGTSDKLHVNISSTLSYQQRYNQVNVLTANQARNYINQYGNDEQKARIGTANTDWQDEVFHNPLATDNNISISGGIKALPYRVSVGYLGQSGLLETTSMKRSSAALNLSPSLFDNHLKIDVNVKAAMTKNRFAPVEGVVTNALRMDPTQPVTGDKYGGYFEYETGDIPNPNAPRNPVAELAFTDKRSTVKRVIGNIQLDYRFHFLPELRAVVNTGMDIADADGYDRVDPTGAVSFTNGGSYKEYAQTKRNKLFDAYLNYAKIIPSAESRIELTAGYSYQDFLMKKPEAATNSIAEDRVISTTAADQQQSTLVSFFGRFNYTWKDKYLLSASIRRDGSSRFAPENRWGTFTGASVAWRISQENFLKNTQVSDLKFRAGIGVTGQQEIGRNYGYLPVYQQGTSQVGYMFGDESVITYRGDGYEPNIKWETTTMYNLGLDYGFWGNRLNGTIDFYQKDTRDLLNDVLLPAGANLTNHVYTNIGSMVNKGFEVSINGALISTETTTWNMGFNMAYNYNRITKLTSAGANDETIVPTGGIQGGTGSNIQAQAVGQQINSFYVYQQVYGSNGLPLEGVYAIQDNGNLLYFYKAPNPKVTFGFNTQLNYKNWTFSASMHGSLGNYLYNNVKSANGFKAALLDPLGYNANANRDLLKTNFDVAQYFSDYYMENASFLRMDNIVVGYNFGRIANGAMGLQVNAMVQNAFVITKYSGLDPEQFSGIDRNVYPKPRIWSLGVNLNF